MKTGRKTLLVLLAAAGLTACHAFGNDFYPASDYVGTNILNKTNAAGIVSALGINTNGTSSGGGVTNAGTGLTLTGGTMAIDPMIVPTNTIWAFGARGGTNDDSAAFQAAAASGNYVIVPGTNFTLNSILRLTNSGALIGAGATLLFPSTNKNAIIATNCNGFQMSGFTLLGGDYVTFSGSSVLRTNNARYGLLIDPYMPNSSFAISIAGFDYALAFTNSKAITSGQSYSVEKTRLAINCYSNGVGCYIFSAATGQTRDPEYLTIQGCQFVKNVTNFWLNTANIEFRNNALSDGLYAAWVEGNGGTANGVHSIIAGCNMNHSYAPLYCKNLTNGGDYLTVSGNTMFGNSQSIYLDNCQDVSICDNSLNITIVNGINGGGHNMGPNFFYNNRFNTLTANTLALDYFSSTGYSWQMTTTNNLIHGGNYNVANTLDNDGVWPPYATNGLNSITGTFTGNGAAVTNVSGANIQTGTINSNKLDAATIAMLGGASLPSALVTNNASYPFTNATLRIPSGGTIGVSSGAIDISGGSGGVIHFSASAGDNAGHPTAYDFTDYTGTEVGFTNYLTKTGNGSGLTNLNAANIATNTSGALSNLTAYGTVTATAFISGGTESSTNVFLGPGVGSGSTWGTNFCNNTRGAGLISVTNGATGTANIALFTNWFTPPFSKRPIVSMWIEGKNGFTSQGYVAYPLEVTSNYFTLSVGAAMQSSTNIIFGYHADAQP